MTQQRSLAGSLASWSVRHRLSAVVGWLLLVIVTMLIGARVGQVTMSQAEYGSGESGQAQRLLTNAGIADPAQELVMVSGRSTTVNPDALASAADSLISGVRATGLVTDIRTPVASRDGHNVLVQFAMQGKADKAADRVQPVLDAVKNAQAAHPDVRISQFGEASANKWFNDTVGKDFSRAEWTAVPLALGILLVVFGALLAAALPVLLALTAFLAANGLLALISHAMHVDTSASSVMLLMGLAVGVDYCLFYLRREREERAAGAEPRRSLEIAAATSGRSVLISGMTVIVAMAGMFLSGMQLFAGFAVATISVVLIAVIGSVTVLPAIMSLLGDKVELGRVPLLHRARGHGTGGRFWNTILHGVLRRPGVSAVLATGLLLSLAAPAVGMHTETLSIDKILPSSTPIVQTYHRIMTAFPGGPAPAVVVVKAQDIQAPQVRQAIVAFQQAVRGNRQFGTPVDVNVYPSRNIAKITVPLIGSGSDAASRGALATLHDNTVPATLGKIPGGQALVSGSLAQSLAFTSQLRHGIVPVFLFVLTVTFVLMLLAFGSIVIPATTIALNLLSVGAAYGAMVAVFQHGWGASLIGTTAVGAIESWIPLFVFVVLFGLSMDYHVFVVSRIKEAHDRGQPTREAVASGIRSTAGVVTSAAIIMVAVFGVFGTLSLQQFKQLSVGLGVAVLLDATIVRAVLLPSVMTLLGEHNWYLPRWLSWLPKRSLSVPDELSPQPPDPQPSRRHVDAAVSSVRSTSGSGSSSRDLARSAHVRRT